MPPAGGAAVMGTGIVSIGFDLVHQSVLSQILFTIDVLLWLGLSAVFLRRRVWQRQRWLQEARSPAALTVIAGTAVLGARVALAGTDWAAWLLLAIATLACARTTAALTATSTLAGLHGVLEDATLALWSAAALWLPVLLVSEAVAPRLRYDTRRWSTVFPFGMYAVCSITAGGGAGVKDIASFGRAWIWAALAVWIVVFAGMLHRAIARR